MTLSRAQTSAEARQSPFNPVRPHPLISQLLNHQTLCVDKSEEASLFILGELTLYIHCSRAGFTASPHTSAQVAIPHHRLFHEHSGAYIYFFLSSLTICTKPPVAPLPRAAPGPPIASLALCPSLPLHFLFQQEFNLSSHRCFSSPLFLLLLLLLLLGRPQTASVC